MPKWFTGFGILCVSLLGVLFTGYSVNASSIYDDFVRTTDTLIVDQNGYVQDITLDWYSELLNNQDSSFQGTNPDIMKQCMSDRLEDGKGWAISQYELENSDIKQVSLFCASSGNETAEFTGTSPRMALMISNSIMCTFSSASNVLKLNCDVTYTSRAPLSEIFEWAGEWRTPLFVNYDVTYPVGYEGEIIPDTYIPPAPPLNWIPDLHMVSVMDWKITLQDRNFNTFDQVPFTCDQGLTPVIQYDLYNNDTNPITKLDTGVFSATIPYEFQSENYGVETEYKFIGNYYCDDGINTFSNQKTIYFTVNEVGAYVPATDTCYTDSFPFIDMTGCTGVMENLLNNLSFGAITFPDWSIEKNNCHTLGIIGDWIDVPNSSRTICPQFSEGVRNIVTPFLTFVLGITILGVLVTKSGRDTH